MPESLRYHFNYGNYRQYRQRYCLYKSNFDTELAFQNLIGTAYSEPSQYWLHVWVRYRSTLPGRYRNGYGILLVPLLGQHETISTSAISRVFTWVSMTWLWRCCFKSKGVYCLLHRYVHFWFIWNVDRFVVVIIISYVDVDNLVIQWFQTLKMTDNKYC